MGGEIPHLLVLPLGTQTGPPREDWRKPSHEVLAEGGEQQAQLNPFPSSSIQNKRLNLQGGRKDFKAGSSGMEPHYSGRMGWKPTK